MTGLPLNIDLQQILLHMMNFVILAGGLYFILYKPVSEYMEKRRQYYAGIEQEAEARKAEAESLAAKYQEDINNAMAEAGRIKETAAREADEIIAKSREEAEIESRRILEEADVIIAKEKDKMVQEAKQEIIELVIEAEKKLLSGESTDEE